MGPPKVTAVINVPSDNIPPSTQEIIDQFDTVFQGTRLLKNFELQLRIDPTIVLVQQPVRRVPYHTKEKISTELSRLLKLDIIEKVDGQTTWLNPIFVVPKSSEKIRLCLDMRQANKAIIRERHIIPKIENILTELHGATYFSKIDLTEGYHQINLDPNSRHITTFATHQGLYEYKTLIYGISSTFESFQKQIEITISGCPNAKKTSDDILIWGNTLEERNENLRTLLQRILDSRLKINPNKCKFAATKIIFGGHILSAEEISPDPEKIKSVNQLQAPTNITEIKSLLGMTNFCNTFIPNYSTITAPLRQLLKKDEPFRWGSQQQAALTS